MTDLVEKVARAICTANCDNPDEEALAFLTDNVTGHAWEGYIPHARAAIAAVLAEIDEPTPEMIYAAGVDANVPPTITYPQIASIWRAMLAVARKEAGG